MHFFFSIRFKDADYAILMNLSTYFLCYWLFSSALITLLDRLYITRRRQLTHITLWIIFSALSGIALLLLPDGPAQRLALVALAAWLGAYGMVLARRVIIAYRKANRIFNDTQADDIGAYIKWLSIFTYWAIIFGVGCGVLTFLPDRYVYIWILSSVPFYSYLFYSYLNYMIFYEHVERTLEIENEPVEETAKARSEKELPEYFDNIERNLIPWLEEMKSRAGLCGRRKRFFPIERKPDTLGCRRMSRLFLRQSVRTATLGPICFFCGRQAYSKTQCEIIFRGQAIFRIV